MNNNIIEKIIDKENQTIKTVGKVGGKDVLIMESTYKTM